MVTVLLNEDRRYKAKTTPESNEQKKCDRAPGADNTTAQLLFDKLRRFTESSLGDSFAQLGSIWASRSVNRPSTPPPPVRELAYAASSHGQENRGNRRPT